MYTPNLRLIQFGGSGRGFFAQADCNGGAGFRIDYFRIEAATEISDARPHLIGITELVGELLKDRPEDGVDILRSVNHVLHAIPLIEASHKAGIKRWVAFPYAGNQPLVLKA